MKPELALAQLRRVKAWEYVVRFVFGGVIATMTGLIAQQWGPSVAGLFLAFPAILPASLTLVKQHDGRANAVDDVRGARLGTVGLAAFALTVWVAGDRWSFAVVLTVAAAVWAATVVAAWTLVFRRQ